MIYFSASSEITLIVLNDKMTWTQKALRILKELTHIEENEKGELYSYDVLSRLSELWSLILKNIPPENMVSENITSSRTKTFLEYIEAHYAEDVSIEEIAKSANVSKSECLRCFKTALQTTPYRYLMDYRLSKASALLKETNLSINEIAIRSGFNGQSYFAKCFKEKMNCSPSQYRLKQLLQQSPCAT